MTDIDEQPTSETTRGPVRRRPARLAVIVIVAVLLFGEAGARILEPRLPALDSWGSSNLDDKIEAVLDLQGTGLDVVFLGSSAVNRGFDANLFTDLTGATAFNAGVDASSPRLMEVLLEEVVLPTLDPDVVVIGLTSRAFNDNALTQQEILDRYLNSVGRAEFRDTTSIKQRLESVADQVSAFVRLRPLLRQPKQLIDAIRGKSITPPETTDPPYTIDPNWAQQMANRALADYQIGDLEMGALGRVVDALQADGVLVVLVDLPVVEDDWADLHPHGVADINAFHAALAAFASGRNIDLIDTREESWPIDQFRDPVHLNLVGQERLTRMVAGFLADRL